MIPVLLADDETLVRAALATMLGLEDDLDGIDAAADLLALTPNAGTLIVTSHGRPGYLKRALSVGVRGFLPKTASAATLADVIRTVHRGGRYVDPELAAEAHQRR
jgi:two-component system response regulator DesR